MNLFLHLYDVLSCDLSECEEWGYRYRTVGIDKLDELSEEALCVLVDIKDLGEDQVETLRRYFSRTEATMAVLLFRVSDTTLRRSLQLMTQTLWIEGNLDQEWLGAIKKHCKEFEKIKHYHNVLKTRSHRSGLYDAIGAIAHQWRQPINLISMEAINLTFKARLNSMVPSADIISSTDSIAEQTQRMSKILTNILSMGKEQRYKELFSTKTLFSSIEQFFTLQLKQNNIELVISKEEAVSEIYGYQTDLEEVIINLIANARDAYKEKIIKKSKIIAINVSESATTLCIDVIDNAGGVPMEIREQIFERDFSTKKEGEGFGIGLHIARLIVENEFHGSLDLYVHENGSHFQITLPKRAMSNLKQIY